MFDPSTTTGALWPEGEPVPADFLAAFENTSDPFDGLIQLSAEWLVKNLPELTGLKFVMAAPGACRMPRPRRPRRWAAAWARWCCR